VTGEEAGEECAASASPAGHGSARFRHTANP
jgi:hypothetical protein